MPEPRPEPEPAISPFEWKCAKKKSYHNSPPLDIQYAKSTYIKGPYERRWTQFRDLRFAGDKATISANPDLLANAKLYVFATRYLVDALREQYLKSLHHDPYNFSLNRQSITHIIDLLEYAYDKTGGQEPGGCYSLRKLAILYISCEARTLAEIPRFRRILDVYGEMACDLVAKLVE